jgi:hypothetical protein
LDRSLGNISSDEGMGLKSPIRRGAKNPPTPITMQRINPCSIIGLPTPEKMVGITLSWLKIKTPDPKIP